MRLTFEYLGRATADGNDLEARQAMMLAAVYGGIAMDQAGLGMVHALSGGVCSHLHLHHGLANAMMLPEVFEFNVDAIAADRRQRISVLAGLEPDASSAMLVAAISRLVSGLGLPIGRQTRSMGDAVDWDTVDWHAVAEESMRMVMMDNNPRTVGLDDCHRILASLRG